MPVTVAKFLGVIPKTGRFLNLFIEIQLPASKQHLALLRFIRNTGVHPNLGIPVTTARTQDRKHTALPA